MYHNFHFSNKVFTFFPLTMQGNLDLDETDIRIIFTFKLFAFYFTKQEMLDKILDHNFHLSNIVFKMQGNLDLDETNIGIITFIFKLLLFTFRYWGEIHLVLDANICASE